MTTCIDNNIFNPFTKSLDVKPFKRTKSLQPSPMGVICDKQDLLLESLKKFYKKSGNKELILPIVKQQTTISLRLLDWLVTNYSKQHDIHYKLNSIGEIKQNFNIWLDYKCQLKAFSKKNFDPFCRRKRIFYNTVTDDTLPIDKKDTELFQKRNDGFVTTVGQLNFFRWALTHRVVDYAFEHLDTIESDMLSSADSRKTPVDKGKRRRRELSKNSKGVHKHTLKVVIQFP
jgi:hypothetical protein